MTSDHGDFLRTIIANPKDDTCRLVFADWLEEQGEQERAEFIRVQCDLARLKCEWQNESWNRAKLDCKDWNERLTEGRVRTTCKSCLEITHLRQREKELYPYRVQKWCPLPLSRNGHILRNYHRGFVNFISCDYNYWLTYYKQIQESTPLEKCALTTYPDGGPTFDESFPGGTKAYLEKQYGIEFELPINYILGGTWQIQTAENFEVGDFVYSDSEGYAINNRHGPPLGIALQRPTDSVVTFRTF